MGLFNGDEYSMGSNGEYISGREDTYLGLQDINFPPGTGGGCVYSGPFSNTSYTTNLGPIDSPYNNNVEGHFDFNPRCLVRDLNSWFSQRYNTYTMSPTSSLARTACSTSRRSCRATSATTSSAFTAAATGSAAALRSSRT